MTVAKLGFAIDSSQAENAAADLDKLTSSAMKTEQAAQRAGVAGTRMSRGFADLNPILDKIVGSLTRLETTATSIDKRLDAMAHAATRTAKATGALDQSAIEASTAYKQLEASLNAVTAAQRKGDAELNKSLSSIEKQRAAIARLNAELQKLRASPSSGFPGGHQPANSNNSGNQGSVGNIAAQLFDIGATAPFMNPATVGLQQGPQLAQAFAGQSTKQAVASLGAGLAAIASPVSLAAIGLTTAAAAAVSLGVGFLTSGKEAENFDKILKRHEQTIDDLTARWGGLLEKQSQYGQRSSLSIGFGAEMNTAEVRKTLRKQVDAVLGDITSAAGEHLPEIGGARAFRANPMFRLLTEDVDRLVKAAKDGTPDIVGLSRRISEMAAASTNPGIRKLADDIVVAIGPVEELARKLLEAEMAAKQLFNAVGPNGMLLSQGTINRNDRGDSALFESRNRVAAERSRASFDAQIFSLGARSPQERAEAAKRTESARYDQNETSAQRRQRIEQAGALALAQAEKQLADAQRDRALNLDKILSDQQSEIDLIGKTGGAAVALRKEYELTSQLRMDAARQGIEVDQKELDLIKERAAALGELTDIYNKRRFDFDMGQQAGDARLSARDLKIVSTLRTYGLPEDLSGDNAARIGQQYDWQQAKDTAKGFGSAFSSELISGSHDIGKSFLKGFEAALMSSTAKLWEKFFDGVGNIFADWVTGSKGGAGTSAIGSVAAKALGVGGAANDNAAYAAPVTAVARAALPATTEIGTYIRDAALKRGIDPDIALRVAKSEGGLDSWNLQSNYVKNGVREPSFGPFQLYKGGGLGNKFMAKTGLDPALAANGPAGVDFALDEAKKSGWGAWYGAGKAGIGNWEGIDKSAKAVEKLGEAATDTAKMTVGLGQTLGSIPQALMANGGGSGIFSSLTKYGMGLFSQSSQFASAWLKGGVGLYANGTSYAPGGMSIVGERGPELLNLPQGSAVTSNHKLMSALAANQNGGGIAGIRLFVDQDGNWQAKVESIARKQSENTSRQSLGSFKQNQQRSGFGNDQKTYNSRKG